MLLDAPIPGRNLSLLGRRRPDVERLRRTGDIAGLCAAARYIEPLRGTDGRPEDLGAPIRLKAIAALSEFYGPEVIRVLGHALGDASALVRRAAVRGLRSSGSPAATEPLLHALAVWRDDIEESSKSEALAAVLELDADELPERFAVRLVRGRSALPTGEHESILRVLIGADARGVAAAQGVAGALIPRLGAEDAHERAASEAVLEWVAPDATQMLIDCLDGPSRRPAARLLGASGQTRAVDALAGLLTDQDLETRLAAVRGLGSLRHTRAVEPLLFATRDSEIEVRKAAEDSLDALGVAGVVVGLAAAVRPVLAAGDHRAAAELVAGEQAFPWAQRVVRRLAERAAEAG